MAEYKLNKSRTALLMADFHNDVLNQNPVVKERQMLERAREVLDAARKAGIFVAYVVVNFRPGYPDVSDNNKWFKQRKTSGQVPPADPVKLIHTSVLPQEGEPVAVKHRVNALYGSDLEMILRGKDINTLILMGHATSGVILSTVRYAADADYQLLVVEDGCADRQIDVHKMLMEKVFPMQAYIVSAAEVVKELGAL